jgi:hypothetical protein
MIVSMFYVSRAERGVLAVTLALLAGVPGLAERCVESTTFAGTPSEDVYRLERIAPGSHASAGRVVARAAEGKADPVELIALGRYHLRRGEAEAAVSALEKAVQLRTNDARLLVNMGNALFSAGNTEGALQAYKSATEADPQFADAHFNLAKMYLSKGGPKASEPAPEVVEGEAPPEKPAEKGSDDAERGQVSMKMALALDGSLEARKDLLPAPGSPMRGLASPSLLEVELRGLETPPERAEAVRRQLAGWLFGGSGSTGFVLPVVLVLALFALGFLARPMAVSRRCKRCAGPVCRRCYDQLRPTALECGECTLLFAKSSELSAAAKIRKQIELTTYQRRWQRVVKLGALLVAGGGHLLSGAPVRGALFALLAAFLGATWVFQGMFRGPYGSIPLLLITVPTVVLLVATVLISLRSLQKVQGEES